MPMHITKLNRATKRFSECELADYQQSLILDGLKNLEKQKADELFALANNHPMYDFVAKELRTITRTINDFNNVCDWSEDK